MLRRLLGFHALHVAGGAVMSKGLLVCWGCSNEQRAACAWPGQSVWQCGSVGGQSVCLAPPGSSWLLLAPPWLRLAAPGSSWLLSAPFGSSCSPSSSCLCCASLGCAGRLAARALPLSRPEHKLLLHMRARAPNLMTQTLDDMGASWPQDFMIACRHMQVCVRRCVTWVASWPQDFMIACRHVQVCVCARVRYRREPMKRQKAQKAMTQTVIRWVIRGVWCSWLSPGSPPGPITDHKERR